MSVCSPLDLRATRAGTHSCNFNSCQKGKYISIFFLLSWVSSLTLKKKKMLGFTCAFESGSPWSCRSSQWALNIVSLTRSRWFLSAIAYQGEHRPPPPPPHAGWRWTKEPDRKCKSPPSNSCGSSRFVSPGERDAFPEGLANIDMAELFLHLTFKQSQIYWQDFSHRWPWLCATLLK